MRKFLLSLVTLLAIAVSASAQDSYTATGYVRSGVEANLDTLAIGGYVWDGTYSPLITLSEARTVEVSSDKIVVKDWYGYGNTTTGDPYDLVCYLDEDGHITSFVAQVGDTEYPYYNYVYTGLSDYYAVGFTAWTETYADYTQCVSDADTKSGYLFLYGTLWKSDYSSSKSGYYFITWGDYKFEKSLYTYTAKGPVRSAIEENKDSLVIGDYTWGDSSPLLTLSDRDVEVNSDSIIVKDWYGYGNTSVGAPYDLICYLDEDGHITKYAAKVGDTLYPYYDVYVYTGYSTNYCVCFSKWTETYGAYTQSVSDAASKSGYLFLYGTEYSSGNSGYYFLPWGDYKFEVSKYEEQTGILSLKSDDADTPMYNIAGQKVDESYKGIVIKNGKKMLRR